MASALAGLAVACGSADETSLDPASLSLEERGRVVFKKCQACHTLGEGERHRVGPNLWGVLGREAGSRADFNYSRAMTASEVIWSKATLDAYLAKPSDFIPGGRMSFVGLKKPEDRDAVIAYLQERTQP